MATKLDCQWALFYRGCPVFSKTGWDLTRSTMAWRSLGKFNKIYPWFSRL